MVQSAIIACRDPKTKVCAMKIQSGGRDFSLCFLTPTWGADLGHFRWLRRSLEKAGLADVPHVVVAQTEDRHLFQPLARNGVQLRATADVLPPAVECARVQEMKQAQRGRLLTKFRGSLNKRFNWCPSVRYSGWQVQQLTKLQVAAEGDYDVTVVLDSDLLITRPFDLRLFVPDGRVTVFEKLGLTPQHGAWKWHESASRLLKQPLAPDSLANGYWAPPFVFDRVTVRALQQWLQTEYRLPWYEVLLAQPLVRWSEGCTYTMFARAYGDSSRLAFRGNPHLRGLYSKEHRLDPEKILHEALSDPEVFFMFIQSDRREQRRWPADRYAAILSRYFGALNGA